MPKSPPESVPSLGTTTPLPVTVIQPTKGWVGLKVKELWVARELLYFLTLREVKVRYKQTAIGVVWVILQPLMNMLIFTLIFGRLAKMPSDNIPYPVFSMAGVVPWTFFAGVLALTANSLVMNSNLIRKVYFPRLAVPLAAVGSGLVDLAVALLLLFAMLPFYKIVPGARILWLPAFIALAVVAATGVGLWLAALNVEYRDVRYVVPFLVQFWMFATPVVYSSSLLKDPWHSLYGLNPMAGVVEGFRWCVLGSRSGSFGMLAISSLAALALLVSGAYYFRRMERNFADVI
jgi:lipopolysaccharide transport system permease protein